VGPRLTPVKLLRKMSFSPPTSASDTDASGARGTCGLLAHRPNPLDAPTVVRHRDVAVLQLGDALLRKLACQARARRESPRT
jgi:hypothetical protein